MIIRPTEFYKGIENLVTPEQFFDLMGWQDNKFGEHIIKYRISLSHYLLSEKLKSAFGVSMYALSKGLISLGVIALAKTHKSCEGQIKSVEVACDGSRKAHNAKLLRYALRGIEFVMSSNRAVSALKRLALKYNGNKYTNLLPAILGAKSVTIPQNKLEISKELESRCMQVTKTRLNSNMFKLKRDKENYKGNTRVSSTIALINQVFRQKERPEDTISECYRGAFVAGLYILSKWICENKLTGIDEVYLGEFIQDLRMIITDYYNHNT